MPGVMQAVFIPAALKAFAMGESRTTASIDAAAAVASRSANQPDTDAGLFRDHALLPGTYGPVCQLRSLQSRPASRPSPTTQAKAGTKVQSRRPHIVFLGRNLKL